MSWPIRGEVQPFSNGCPELCCLSYGGILPVWGAMGPRLQGHSSNRRASWETLTPVREKRPTFNLRKVLFFYEQNGEASACQAVTVRLQLLNSTLVICSVHACIGTCLTVLRCVGNLTSTATSVGGLYSSWQKPVTCSSFLPFFSADVQL